MFPSFVASSTSEWDVLVTKVWEVQVVERFAVVATLVSIFILASRDLYELKQSGLRTHYGRPEFRLDSPDAEKLRHILYAYCLGLLLFAVSTMSWFLLYALLPNPCNPITIKALKLNMPSPDKCGGFVETVFHPAVGWILVHLFFFAILIIGVWMVLKLTKVRQETVGWHWGVLRGR